MARRGNNEGAIYKRKDGRWEARVTIGYREDGKPIRKSSYHRTRKEAQEEIKRKNELMAWGVSLLQADKTLREWSKIWLETKKPELATTWENYGHALKLVLPTLGHYKLRELKHLQLQQFLYSDIRNEDGKPYSKSTMEKVRCALHSMLKEAEKNELVVKNVAIGLKLPKDLPTPDEREIFTDGEVDKIMSADRGIPFLDAVIVMINTGLRPAELMALLPRNIDFAEGEIHVTNAATRDKGKPVLGPTKTSESIRTIPVSEEVLELLQRRLNGDPEQYLFTNRKRFLINQTTFRAHYIKALKTAGVAYRTPHCCRHTFATRLYKAGVDPKIIQTLMGHTDYALTANIYTHVNTADLKAAVEKL